MPMNKPRFDPIALQAPVPGMSLTTEPGNRPWENPPAIVNVEDAIEFYAEKILNPDKADAILDAMDQEISIESMADMLTTSAVMDGMHTIDISVLVTPIVQEMLRYVGDAYGIDYVESYETQEKKNIMPDRLIRQVVEEKAEESAPKNMAMEGPKSMGLMARKNTTEGA